MKKVSLVLFVMVVIMLAACSPPAATSEVSENSPADTTEAVQAVSEQAATPEPTLPEGVEKVSILLLGSKDKDFSKEGNTYALTHILVTLDPQSRTIRLTTFPYNLAVASAGSQSQLQFVCNEIGEEGDAAVLEENFGIEIDYWVHMNMDAVAGIVDLLSGITIEGVSEGSISGEETVRYFEDTLPENQDDWLVEEEGNFREHHENIINGVVSAVKTLNLDAAGLIAIAQAMQDYYKTDITQEQWQAIADTAIYCLENEPEYLHVPEIIEATEQDEWAMKFTEADATAVREFIGE